MTRRAFGTITRQANGRWLARYTAPDGRKRSKGGFPRKADAQAFLAVQEADVVRRAWRAPERPRETVGDVAKAYLDRPDLRPGVKANYASTWARHLKPWFADRRLVDVTVADVRAWHEDRQRADVGPRALSSAYALLRAVFRRAVDDELVPVSPCRVRGAGSANPVRRGIALTVPQLFAVSGAVPDRYAAAVLVSGFGALRFGEWSELRRRDWQRPRLQVGRGVYRRHVDDPKTRAGVRVVTMPDAIADVIDTHLKRFVPDHPDALIFGTAGGRHLSSSNWSRTWRRAVAKAGLPEGAVSHDLRRSALTLAAQQGATLAELMARAGHTTPAAAMIYQAAAEDRDAALAVRLDAVIAGMVTDRRP